MWSFNKTYTFAKMYYDRYRNLPRFVKTTAVWISSAALCVAANYSAVQRHKFLQENKLVCDQRLIQVLDVDIVDHPLATTIIQDAIRFGRREGGVLVFGSPCGSGKSTYVNSCLFQPQSIREQVFQPNVIITMSGLHPLQDDGIRKVLKIDKNTRISSVVPTGTIFVFDQIDCAPHKITERFVENVTELATDSRNSKKYTVIIIVSDPDVYNMILQCNGGQKVRSLDGTHKTSWLKWDRRQVECFIKSKATRLG
jgi:hypothetical protein